MQTAPLNLIPGSVLNFKKNKLNKQTNQKQQHPNKTTTKKAPTNTHSTLKFHYHKTPTYSGGCKSTFNLAGIRAIPDKKPSVCPLHLSVALSKEKLSSTLVLNPPVSSEAQEGA